MRRTHAQQAMTKGVAIRFFGSGSSVPVFGSRTDDSCRSGGIDLIVRSDGDVAPADLFTLKVKAFTVLQKEPGERKIDFAGQPRDRRNIARHALQAGVKP
ncbi:nucleotidyltransferase domain-containing protein [Chlorobium limicola]|nr:nucleotidyltransferase domain-containing protein [Chlorobium limicola]